MWVDGIIVIILIYTIIQGFRHGFVHTFIHTVGWILAVILGFVWYPHVIDFLKKKTDFYDSVYNKISDRVAENTDSAADSAMTGFPEVIRDLLDKAIDSAANTIAVTMSNLIFNIIGFLVVAIAIKLILMVITMLFSKEKNTGLIGGADGLLGLIAGALKGIILIYILLALMVPVTSLSGSTFLISQLDGSVLGSYLYDNNLILRMVKGFL